jgi:hypothetical protein
MASADWLPIRQGCRNHGGAAENPVEPRHELQKSVSNVGNFS